MNENPTVTETPPDKPRIPDDAVPHFRVLRKLVLSLNRATHHAEYLNECLSRRASPKGLQAKIQPQVPETDLEFTLEWEKTHWEFSRSLTQQLHNYYKKRAKKLATTVERTRQEIITRCSQDTVTYINNLISSLEESQAKTLQEKRQQKIAGTKNTTGQRQTTTTSTTTPPKPSTSTTTAS